MKKTRWFAEEEKQVLYVWKDKGSGPILWLVRVDGNWRKAMWRYSETSEPELRPKKGRALKEIAEEELFLMTL